MGDDNGATPESADPNNPVGGDADDDDKKADKVKEAAAEPVADDAAIERAVAKALKEREERDAQRASTREAAQTAVKAELAESDLPGKAKQIVLDSFREAEFGNGAIYNDEPALRGAVKGEIAKAAALLGMAPAQSKIKGLGETPDSTDGSVREAVAARIEERWGTSGAPKRDEDEAAPVGAGAQGVADRMAGKFGQ